MFIGLYCLFLFLSVTDSAIVEKQKSVCNDHCSILQLHCPRRHRIAIREALYGVHELNSVCPVSMECSDPKREICCEMVGGRDCLFPYPLDHLNSFHTNCSGNVMCSVEMDLQQPASSACSSAEHRNASSYSLIDYVCINDTFTAQICSQQEHTIKGRTLFAIFNPRDYSSPLTNTSCTCTARSQQWRRKTNFISSFAVDLRLTSGSMCSDTKLFMASGGESQNVTCQTSKGDSWFLYPFVSILNSTGDSMATLTLGKHSPDFVWIGFEASFDEEIILSCKRNNPPEPNEPVDGVQNNDESPHVAVNKTHNQRVTPNKSSSKASPAGIAIGTVLGFVAVAVVALVILWLVRRKSKKDEKPATVENQNQNEIHIYADADEELFGPRQDVTYSTVEEITSVSNSYAVPWEFKTSVFDRPGSTVNNDMPATEENSLSVDNDGFEDVYMTPEQVRRNKYLRKQGSAEVEDAPEDVDAVVEDEYVSVEDIKKNKRAMKKECFTETQDTYDKLAYNRKSKEQPPPGYSKLGFFVKKGNKKADKNHSRPGVDSSTDMERPEDCDSLDAEKVSDSQSQTCADSLSNNHNEEEAVYVNSNSVSDIIDTTRKSKIMYELAKPSDQSVQS